MPQFEHDCTACKFIATINEMDIYLCPGNGDPSIIARFSSDGPDYASNRVSDFKRSISENNLISGDGWQMPFRDYLMSDKAIDYHKAWLIALTMV